MKSDADAGVVHSAFDDSLYMSIFPIEINNDCPDVIGGIHAKNIPVKSVDLSDPVINSGPEPFLVQFHDLPQDRQTD